MIYMCYNNNRIISFYLMSSLGFGVFPQLYMNQEELLGDPPLNSSFCFMIFIYISSILRTHAAFST